MITAIEIENFKGIRERVHVDLKPLTLIFGPNSGGKSTLIQAIHYAAEIFERCDPDPQRTESGGDAVDLGGFSNFVHGHDLSRPVRLRFEVAGRPGWSDKLKDLDWAGAGEWFELVELMLEDCRSFWAEVTLAWCESRRTPQITEYEVGFNGQFLARTRINEETDAAELDCIDFRHPLLVGRPTPPKDRPWDEFGLLPKVIPSFEELFSAAARGNPVNPGDRLGFRFHGQQGRSGIISALPSWDEVIEFPGLELESSLSRVQPAANEGRGFFWSGASPLPHALTRLVVEPGKVIRDELYKFRYLGPLRAMPPRSYEVPQWQSRSQWAKGLAAWTALCEADEPSGDLPSVSPEAVSAVAETSEEGWGGGHSRAVDEGGQASLIDDVNRWFRGRLKSGYAVRVRSRTEVESAAIPGGNADLAELRRFIEKLRTSATKKKVILVPDGQSIEVQPHDVGTGISQLLPVVVLAVWARKRLVAIEQPELHLHPALQTELADLFLESALERESRLLIETHSEHIILRLLRRIRETTEGRLPPSAHPLRPEQVSVIYAERTDQGTKLSQLRIHETGEFIDRWPHGFFAERVDELF